MRREQAWVLKRIVSSDGNQGHSLDEPDPLLQGRSPKEVTDTRLHGLLLALACEDDEHDVEDYE